MKNVQHALSSSTFWLIGANEKCATCSFFGCMLVKRRQWQMWNARLLRLHVGQMATMTKMQICILFHYMLLNFRRSQMRNMHAFRRQFGWVTKETNVQDARFSNACWLNDDSDKWATFAVLDCMFVKWRPWQMSNMREPRRHLGWKTGSKRCATAAISMSRWLNDDIDKFSLCGSFGCMLSK